MSNNLIIINAHIVTPQGRTARKGEAMNELLNIPCGTVRITDGIITYVGENRTSHEKPGCVNVTLETVSEFTSKDTLSELFTNTPYPLEEM